jgi:hypothetical protein
MKTLLFKQIFAAAGVFRLLANRAMAAPQAATPSQPASQTAVAPAVVVSTVAASTPQPYAPTGGTFAQILLNTTQPPGYFSGSSPTALGGFLGMGPVGGTFYPGPIGGALNGQIAPGGQMPNAIVTGGIAPGLLAGFPPGGALSVKPPGGQVGSNALGGIRNPSNSLTASPSGVIVSGGAPPAGVAQGGAPLVGASPGGVIIVGGAPSTNAPGGQLH